MSEFSLVSINIFVDLSRWEERRTLLVKQLAELDPDVIALQEVSLETEPSNAHWLAKRLNRKLDEDDPKYEVYLSPKCGMSKKGECLAILTRLTVTRQENLDLRTQNRVAEMIEFRLDGEKVMLVNSHLYFQEGKSAARQKQVELLLDWLDTQPVESPVVVCGDFNSPPESLCVARMREFFDSAHRIIHGDEPEYTWPTPLKTSRKGKITEVLSGVFGQRHKEDIKQTLDYIFVDPRLRTEECRVVLDQPKKSDPTLYPSDHFGIYALIKIS